MTSSSPNQFLTGLVDIACFLPNPLGEAEVGDQIGLASVWENANLVEALQGAEEV